MCTTPEPALLVLTGASGAGKTTLVAALRALGLPGVGCRGQPELARGDMDCWAAYLRGQADALGLHVLDTARPVDVAVAELAALVEELAKTRPTAGLWG